MRAKALSFDIDDKHLLDQSSSDDWPRVRALFARQANQPRVSRLDSPSIVSLSAAGLTKLYEPRL